MIRIPALLRSTVLTLGAILGTLCILWTAALVLLGVTPLVVLSGSMAPALNPGDVAFARTVPASEVTTGDVVSVVSASGVRITHRVIDSAPARSPLGAGAVLHLQGDANDSPDPEAYTVSSVHEVVASVPRLGYLLHAAGSPWGIAAGLALLLACVALGWRAPERHADARHDAAPRAADTSPTRRIAAGRTAARRMAALLALTLVPLFALGSTAAPQNTLAYFSDSPTANSVASGIDAAPWFTCAQAMAVSATTTSPFAYYPFTDAVGSTQADDATGGTDAVMGAAAANYTFGGAQPCRRDGDTGVRFDGAAGYAAGPNVAGYAWNVFTVSLWFRNDATATPNQRGLIGMSNLPTGLGGLNDRKMWLDSQGRVKFGVFTTSQQTITSPNRYDDAKWHMATASLSSTGMRLYVDGELVVFFAGASAGYPYGTEPMYWTVGSVNGWGSGGGYWKGNISKAGIWKRALTDQEIRDMYRSALPLN